MLIHVLLCSIIFDIIDSAISTPSDYIENCEACNTTITDCEDPTNVPPTIPYPICTMLANVTLNMDEYQPEFIYTTTIDNYCYYLTNVHNITGACNTTTTAYDVYDCVTDNDCFQVTEVDDMYDCAACSTEANECDEDQWCFAFANYTINNIGLNRNTTQLGYDNIVNTYWCTPENEVNGMDCTNGFNAWKDCIITNDCLQFECGTEYQACDADPDCKSLLAEYESNFDNYGSTLAFAQANCAAWDVAPYNFGGTKDCSLFVNYMLCDSQQNPCEPDPTDECNYCDIVSTISICDFDPQCAGPWAYLTNDPDVVNPTIDDYCDDTLQQLCTPTDWQTASVDFCANSFAPGCNTDYTDILFPWIYDCYSGSCLFRNCSTEIDTCNAEIGTCKAELKYVSDISDKYGPEGEYFGELVRDYYCKNLPGGDCTTQLRITETCAETCFLGDPSQSEYCYERECITEMTSCLTDDTCAEPVLQLLQDEQSCKVAINDDPNDNCKCAGDGEEDDEWFYFQYGDDCKWKCEACSDDFIESSVEMCRYGDCGANNEINDLYSCIWTNCEEFCPIAQCGNEFGDCLYGNMGDGMCADTFKIFQDYAGGSFTYLPMASDKWDSLKGNELCHPTAQVGFNVGYGSDCVNNGFDAFHNCMESNCGFNYGIEYLCKNGACMYETDDCKNDTWCEHMAEMTISMGGISENIPQLMMDQVIDMHFCTPENEANGIDCSTNGFNNWYGCVVENECIKYTCQTEWEACEQDSFCPGFIKSVIGFSGESVDADELIREECSSWDVSPYNFGGTNDCSTASSFLQCYITEMHGNNCVPDSPTCNFCDIIPYYYTCMFEPQCLVPLAYMSDNGYDFDTDNDQPDEDDSDSIFPSDMKLVNPSYQEECAAIPKLCTPSDMVTDIAAFCDDTLMQNMGGCSSDFNAIFNEMMGCSTDECVWQNCSDIINTCNDDTTCSAQLYEIARVEDTYGIGSELIQQDIREYICRNQPSGNCETELNDAIDCYEGCANFTAIRCYEKQCESEIDACISIDACGTPFLDILANQTACRQEINREYGLLDPPEQCRCPNSDGNNNFDYELYWNVTGYSDECMNMCERCDDSFLPLALEECGSGECGNEFNDVFKCTIRECPTNEDQNDCVSMNCQDQLVDCILETDCYNAVIDQQEDWEQVLEEQGIIHTNALFWPPIFYIKDILQAFYCESDDYSATCSENFYGLWECLVGECTQDICPYQSCKNKLETCYGNDDCVSNMEWFRTQQETACADALTQCRYDEVIKYCEHAGCGTYFYDAINCLYTNCAANIVIDEDAKPVTPCATIKVGFLFGLPKKPLRRALCGWPLKSQINCMIGRDSDFEDDAINDVFDDTPGSCLSSTSTEYDLLLDTEVVICTDCVDFRGKNSKYAPDFIKVGVKINIFNTNAFKFLYYVVDQANVTEWFQSYNIQDIDGGDMSGECIFDETQCDIEGARCNEYPCGISMPELADECKAFVDEINEIKKQTGSAGIGCMHYINFSAIIMIGFAYFYVN